MTRRVVCNTGPVIALSAAGHLDLLRLLYDEVLIPDRVRSEILAGKEDAIAMRDFQNASWIQIRSPAHPSMPLLENALDEGESSVIQVALETNADLVLIDERKGRKIAGDVYGLRVRGTVGILLDAKKLGLLASVGPAISIMRERGYWLDDRIVEEALREAGEE